MITFDRVSKYYTTQSEHLALTLPSTANESSLSAADSAALEQITFALPAGSFNFLTGHSGAGKSTLLKLLAGLTRPSSGEIYFGEYALHALADKKLNAVRAGMGIVFQENQLLDDRSVFDNIALPLIISRCKKAEIVARVGAALERVALSHKADAQPATLSGGEQQRVGIARAVVNRPKVLIADEPTGNLDPDMSRDILKLFRHFNAAGVTVIIATHDTELLKIRHHNRLTLNQGHLVTPSANPVQQDGNRQTSRPQSTAERYDPQTRFSRAGDGANGAKTRKREIRDTA